MTPEASASAVHAGLLRTRFEDAERSAPDDAEIGAYAERLPRAAGLCLDATCGTGRLLIPLLARGVAIHGADASAAALSLAEERIVAAGLEATLYRQDLASLNLPTRFAAAIVHGGAFQRIADREAAGAALERLRAHLVGPGLLILDAFVPAYARSRPGAPLVELRSVALADGSQIRMRSETSIDADAKLARGDARYTHRFGARLLAEEHARHALTWYDPDELVALVSSAGWRDAAHEPSPRASGEGESRFLVTARA
ncbi:hypothetical protein BURK1_00350 [Burkholderiales bacterium]|nr:hypothetical protein BURK1_00350 [Burkholderiales bacterium]